MTESAHVGRFWRGMYTRFEFGVHPRDSLPEVTSYLADHSSSLRDHCRLLEKVSDIGNILANNFIL